MSQKQDRFSKTLVNSSIIFGQIIAAYFENHNKYKYNLWTKRRMFNLKATCATKSHVFWLITLIDSVFLFVRDNVFPMLSQCEASCLFPRCLVVFHEIPCSCRWILYIDELHNCRDFTAFCVLWCFYVTGLSVTSSFRFDITTVSVSSVCLVLYAIYDM